MVSYGKKGSCVEGNVGFGSQISNGGHLDLMRLGNPYHPESKMLGVLARKPGSAG
jgi:hypothetical protein